MKAGLVSEYRHKYNIVKSRIVNDLHHAKDAFLNIVVGNVYNERFTKNFKASEKYSLNYDVLFGAELIRNGKTIWSGEESIKKISSTVQKNNIHYTHFAYCKKGGLFDQQPAKASEGLTPLKKDLDTSKYGGYKKTSACFFTLVRYETTKGAELMIMPVELMHKNKFLTDTAFAALYAKKTIKTISGRDAANISFPLNKRIIKINSTLSLNGAKLMLCGKSAGGRQLILAPCEQLIIEKEYEKYVKSLERFNEKNKLNTNIILDSQYDKITPESNIELYKILTEKLSRKPFSLFPNCQHKTLLDGTEAFAALPLKKQIDVLLNCLLLFKSVSSGVDLSAIGGCSKSGAILLSSNLLNWMKNYSDVRLIDCSFSGIHRKESCNLFDLL